MGALNNGQWTVGTLNNRYSIEYSKKTEHWVQYLGVGGRVVGWVVGVVLLGPTE